MLQEDRRASACALLLLPQAAGHDLQVPSWDTARSRNTLLLRSGDDPHRFAGDDGAGGKQPGSWLLKCLMCTSVAQIQTKCLVTSRMSNPLPIYGHFPSHTTLTHISPDFCWDFALPRLQDLPRAAHGSYLPCSSTFAHRLENFRRHSRLAYLHHSSPPSLVLFLPCSGNCILWHFFFAHSVQSPTSCRVPLLFFPHVINSLMQFPVICSLVPLVSRHHQMPSYLKLVIIYIQRPSFTISLTADQE